MHKLSPPKCQNPFILSKLPPLLSSVPLLPLLLPSLLMMTILPPLLLAPAGPDEHAGAEGHV